MLCYVANAIIIIISCTYVRMFTRMCFVRTYVARRTETEVESTAKGALWPPDIHHKGWPAVEGTTLKIYKDRTKLLWIPHFPTVSCCSFLYVTL